MLGIVSTPFDSGPEVYAERTHRARERCRMDSCALTLA